MIKINSDDIAKLNITSREMVEWVNDALLHKDNAILPAKTSMKMQNGALFYNVMPCVIQDVKTAGIKVVTRYPERTPSLNSNIFLYNLETGYLNAIIEGDFITTWRTAAVAVHSIKLFAVPNYKIISFIGMGVIGKATLKVYLDTLDTNENITVRIFNYKNRGLDIINEFSKYCGNNVKWELFDSYVDMIKDSDVVVSSVTFMDNDFCDQSLYKEGVLLVPVHTRGFQQCDLTFDKIFGDDTDHIKPFKYFNQFKQFNEVSDVLLNRVKGRENNKERIIAYNVGIALHDINFASKIINRIKKQ